MGILVAALYAVTHAGRIDIIDAQIRFDTLTNLWAVGRPFISDPALIIHGVPGLDGDVYAGYGFGALLSSLPLQVLALAFGDPDAERMRFFFSLTGAFLGAGGVILFTVSLGRLGVGLPKAVAWSLVLAFGSLWWPASVSTFDQVHQGFFLTAALFCAWQGAERDIRWVIAVGGLAGGMLINFAESYVLVLPLVGLAALTPHTAAEPWRPRIGRYLLFGGGIAINLVLWLAYNQWRFGDPLMSGRGIAVGGVSYGASPYPTFGNPLVGAVSLLVSPGKGVLWYCPVVVLTALGWRRFRSRAPWLATTVALTCLGHAAVVSSLRFFGGDWGWGPRYLVPILPLLALPWAFVGFGRRAKAAGIAALVAISGLVQAAGIAVDHHRFFFERELHPFLWLDPWVYFKHSQLAARPAEIASLVRAPPLEATRFVPAPYEAAVTYAPFGPNPTNAGSEAWMKGFSVFYLPRPWPFWMAALPRDLRPFGPGPPTAALVVIAALALVGLIIVVHRETHSRSPPLMD